MEKRKKIGLVMPAFMGIITAAVLIPAKSPDFVQEDAHCFMDYAAKPSAPEVSVKIEDGNERKTMLIEMLLPLVLKANEEITAQRAELLRIRKTSFYLTLKEMRFIEDLAVFYKVEAEDHREMIDELLLKVDVLPTSLVIAQAAIESGWGTSRFALKGNNVFGIRNGSGRGMIPKERRPEDTFAISTFDDLQTCINFYIWNINTRHEYEHLRQIRAKGSSPYDSLELAKGLHLYSETGYAYVDKVKNLIMQNNLQAYDSCRLRNDQAASYPAG